MNTHITRIAKRLLRGPRAWRMHRQILRAGGSVNVSSAALTNISYDPGTKTLHISFKHGGIYDFSSVPRDEVKGLLTAPSRGRYFVHNIRNEYEYKKLS